MHEVPRAYADVLLLTTLHDAEWTRRHTFRLPSDKTPGFDDSLKKIGEEIQGICVRYRDGIEKCAAAAYPAAEHSLEKGLYESRYYYPLTRSDVIALTMVDDPDPVHNLTAHCSTMIEEVSFSICPTISSILDELHAPKWSRDCFPDTAFDSRKEALPPLLAYTRVKLAGHVHLGQATFAQHAALKAIVASSLQVLDRLDSLAGTVEPSEPFELLQADVKSTRILFVEAQGQEELAVIILSSNFTITAALLHRMECIDLEDLVKQDVAMEARMQSMKWFSTATRFLQDLRGASKTTTQIVTAPSSTAELFKELLHSHALRWSRTTLAVSRECFQPTQIGGAQRPVLHGLIDLVGAANLNMGHASEFDRIYSILENEFPRAPSNFCSDANGNEAPSTQKDAGWRVVMGSYDGIVCHSDLNGGKTRFQQIAVALKMLVRLMELATDSCHTDSDTGVKLPARTLVEYTLFPAVPIPADDIFRKELKPHYPLFSTILPPLVARMTLDHARTSREEVRAGNVGNSAIGTDELEASCLIPTGITPSNGRGLSTTSVCSIATGYLLPRQLILKIEYLFQDFLNDLANPHLFDSVLDLLDGFLGLQSVLTDCLPAVYPPAGDGYPTQISAEAVNQISRYVSALDRAKAHRLYHAFPEDGNRESNVDFRGGFNQTLIATDAVVKNIIGLVKRYAVKWKPHDNCPDRIEQEIESFGVVHKIDFEPGIFTFPLRMGVERKTRLAIIRSDVPHLYLSSSYLDLFHEGAHLAFEERRMPRDRAQKPLLPSVPLLSSTERELAEIYSNVLTCLIVCRDSPRKLILHLAVSFSQAPRPGYSLQERFSNQQGYLARMYFIRKICMEMRFSAAKSDWFTLSPADVRERIEALFNMDFDRCFNQFTAFVEEQRRYIHDFEPTLRRILGVDDLKGCTTKLRLATTEEWKRTARGAFLRQWRRMRYNLPMLAADVLEVFQAYGRQAIRNSSPAMDSQSCPPYRDLEQIEKRIISCLGPPDNPSSVPLAISYARDGTPGNSGLPDGMLQIAGCLRATLDDLWETLGPPTKGRNPLLPINSLGKISFPEACPESSSHEAESSQSLASSYCDLLIRPGDARLFCCLPEVRRRRVRRQITILKTLTNIGSELKARRLAEIMRRHLSDSPDRLDADQGSKP